MLNGSYTPACTPTIQFPVFHFLQQEINRNVLRSLTLFTHTHLTGINRLQQTVIRRALHEACKELLKSSKARKLQEHTLHQHSMTVPAHTQPVQTIHPDLSHPRRRAGHHSRFRCFDIFVTQGDQELSAVKGRSHLTDTAKDQQPLWPRTPQCC